MPYFRRTSIAFIINMVKTIATGILKIATKIISAVSLAFVLRVLFSREVKTRPWFVSMKSFAYVPFANERIDLIAFVLLADHGTSNDRRFVKIINVFERGDHVRANEPSA